MMMKYATRGLAALAAGLMVSATMLAQAPRQTGTVKSTDASGLVLTTAAGQDYTVTVPATAKVLLVDPKTMDAKAATAGTLGDVAVGDKAIVMGTAGDTGTTLTAARVYLMKAAALAQTHAAEAQAWAQGGGGIVKSIDAGSGAIVVSSGMKTVTVLTTPKTILRHYAGGSVNFSDAVVCKLGDIKVGDQLRMRGAKSDDGLTVTADEVVAGTFHNYSGLLTAVDAASGTVSLKDLATKKPVTVTVIAGSDVRRIAPMMAQRIAAGMKGTAANAAAASRPAGAGGQGGPGGGPGGPSRAGFDLSQMLSRLPTERLAGLKAGDAVMIVASSSPGDPGKSTAVTLLVGVEPILTAAPEGGEMLTPWNMGGAPGGEMGGGGGGK